MGLGSLKHKVCAELPGQMLCCDGDGHSGGGVGTGPRRWYITESYAVRRHRVVEICKRFGVMPAVDMFASAENARFPKFQTVEDNSLQTNWPQDVVLWCNPPWSLWPAVVDKIYQQQARVICIAPAWTSLWLTKLLQIAVKKLYFPKGEKFFELLGRPCKGLRWGVWAVLADGKLAQAPVVNFYR